MHAQSDPLDTRPRHFRVGLGALALVLLAHATLLGLWADARGGTARPGAPELTRPLAVRQIVLAPPLETPPTPAAAAPQPKGRPPPAPFADAERLAPASPPAAVVEHGAGGKADGEESDADATADADESGENLPIYTTRLPPSQRLLFSLQRGGRQGTAELDWAAVEGRYRLSLQSQLPSAPGAAWVSTGALEGAGVAPRRYTENRRGREVRAANFQREAGLISFSGPRAEYPLVEGAQDRLSWLIQLGAVLSANPELAQPGAQVRLFVVGTRGDARTWVFTVQSQEDLTLPGGDVHQALYLLREPRRPYDTRAQVWLDPARQYLPVRLHLKVLATGEGTLMELQQAR